MPEKPSALTSTNGSMSAKMPIVLMMNCTWSARVIDHMPPMTEYTSTTAPPMAMQIQLSRPVSTCRTVAYAPVEVTTRNIV